VGVRGRALLKDDVAAGVLTRGIILLRPSSAAGETPATTHSRLGVCQLGSAPSSDDAIHGMTVSVCRQAE